MKKLVFTAFAVGHFAADYISILKKACRMNFNFIFLILFFSCFLSSSFYSQCFTAGQSIEGGVFLKSTGVKEIDEIVIDEVNKLERFFGFDVHFLFQQESVGFNAHFYYQCEYGCTGTVALGINYLVGLFERHKSNAYYIFQYALAHEFAHGAQKLGYWNEGYKRPELHADFLAGFYIGKNYNYSNEILASFREEARFLSDNNIYCIQHHGTEIERECAFLEGYYYAKENYANIQGAYSYGFQYVASNNPCAVRKYKAAVQAYQNEIDRRKNQLEIDIKNNNVGTIKFKSLDKKKYKIVTINGSGQQVVYPINQVYYNINNYGQRVLKNPINEISIYPISHNSYNGFVIYKSHWLFGDMPIFQFNPKICRGNTVEVTFSKSSQSIKNLCP